MSGTVKVTVTEYERLRGIEQRARRCIQLDNQSREATPDQPFLWGYARSLVAHILDDPRIDPMEPAIQNPEAIAAVLSAASVELALAARELAS